MPAGGKIGLLWELRIPDGKKINEATCNKIKEKIEGKKGAIRSGEFAAFAWTGKADYLVDKHGKVTDQATCESVGAHFTSDAKPSSDMCDHMTAKTMYAVVKVYNSMKKTAADTSYTVSQ